MKHYVIRCYLKNGIFLGYYNNLSIQAKLQNAEIFTIDNAKKTIDRIREVFTYAKFTYKEHRT